MYTTIGANEPVTFGTHKGVPLSQLVFRDTDYFIWAVEKNIFPGPYAVAARTLYRRITSIRIPAKFGPSAVAEYLVQPGSGAFAGLQIRERGQPNADARRGALVLDVIDLSVPRRLHRFDKTGMKIMQRDFKEIVFGNPDVRLTRRRIDAFLNDPAHFTLPADGTG